LFLTDVDTFFPFPSVPPPPTPQNAFNLRDFLYCLILEDGRLRLNCDSPRAETKFRLSAKRTSPFKSAGASVQSTTGSRGLRISGSNARCAMFRISVKGTGYPFHSAVSSSLPFPASPCATTFQLDSTVSDLLCL
jgi:hypothetical protein